MNVQSDPHSFHAYHQQLLTVELVGHVKRSVGFGEKKIHSSKNKVCAPEGGKQACQILAISNTNSHSNPDAEMHC